MSGVHLDSFQTGTGKTTLFAEVPQSTVSHVHTRWGMLLCIYIYIYIHIHVYTTYMYIHLIISLSIYIYIYIYMCTHIHIYIYIYIHILAAPLHGGRRLELRLDGDLERPLLRSKQRDPNPKDTSLIRKEPSTYKGFHSTFAALFS